MNVKKLAPLDEEAKARVAAALRAQLQEEDTASRREEAVDREAAALDQGTTLTVDDLSQSDADGQFVEQLEAAEAHNTEKLRALDALDLSSTDTVAPGAVIVIDGDWYLVGIAGGAFSCEGVAYECISLDSPMYAAIDGLREGARFTLRDRDHLLELVC